MPRATLYTGVKTGVLRFCVRFRRSFSLWSYVVPQFPSKDFMINIIWCAHGIKKASKKD